MGCASSAALPFLTGRPNQTVTESANGKPPYELKMVNDSVNGVKDLNETFISGKMKDMVDSSTVQGVIGGVVSAKNEIVSQVHGAGEAVVGKVSSIVGGVENTIESTFGQVSEKLEEVEEKVKTDVKHVGEKISSVVGLSKGEQQEKEDDIDELLAAMPDDENVSAPSTIAAEDLIEAEEVAEDVMKN